MKTRLLIILSLALTLDAYAGSATWNLNPVSSEWNTAANWTPMTVPNGALDTATFDLSNTTSISLSSNIVLAGMIFDSAASSFNITLPSAPGFLTLTIRGSGITNDSSASQNLIVPISSELLLKNDATVGDLVTVTNQGDANNVGGITAFFDRASAGNGVFTTFASTTINGVGAEILFFDSSTAGNGDFTNYGATATAFAGLTLFFGRSSAGNATFTNVGFPGFGETGSTRFLESATADHATIIDVDGGTISFSGTSTAADATMTNNGATSSLHAGIIGFGDQSSAGNASIVNAGGDGVGALMGAQLFFQTDATAGNAAIVAEGGVNGGPGAGIIFEGNTTGGTASFDIRGNAKLAISTLAAPGLTIGSLEGDGLVFLGSKVLAVGSNNRSTTFAGLIQDSGSLVKINRGKLVLTNANTYSGGTTIQGGSLFADNRTGSATGSGFVHVDAGMLGGRGIISGPVTIGTGSGSGAFISPAGSAVGVLRLQNTLVFKSDATYLAGLDSDRVRRDKVTSNGVTIDGGALISLVDLGSGIITPGITFTLINNTSPTAISGIFSNLPDGSAVTVGSNTYQASYTGGDGNDLTLTVVL